MADTVAQELLKLTQQLLDAIVRADWNKYQDLCDPSITCFEPEALGQLVAGLDFHHFYFKLGAVKGEHCTSLASPHVRVMDDVAVVSYLRRVLFLFNLLRYVRFVRHTKSFFLVWICMPNHLFPVWNPVTVGIYSIDDCVLYRNHLRI